MPIKWSALRVSEAMDMVEEFVNQAAGPLEQANIVVNEARNIANLPLNILTSALSASLLILGG